MLHSRSCCYFHRYTRVSKQYLLEQRLEIQKGGIWLIVICFKMRNILFAKRYKCTSACLRRPAAATDQTVTQKHSEDSAEVKDNVSSHTQKKTKTGQ